MKNMVILMLFVSTMLTAQTHLTFKDLPITGTEQAMATKLVNQGYTLNADGSLSGSFAGYNASVVIVATKANVVWKVIVLLDDRTTWRSIKDDFTTFKEALNNKYGAGQSFEFFTKPYYLGDGYEMQALSNDKATYATFYELSTGTIVLKMHRNGFVLIEYEDKAGAELKKAENEATKKNDL